MIRRGIWIFLGVVWTGMVLFSGCRTYEGRVSEADVVLTDGIIHTMDADRTVADAAAVRNGRFVCVGTVQGASEFIGRNTRVIDLEKRLVLPGFVDSHCHPISAFRQFYEINLYGLGTSGEYQRAVKTFIDEHPGISFVRGRGWSNTLFPGTGPDRKILDEVAKDLPVKLSSEDGHSVWVNSRTLELAGITAGTEDPLGGIIERYPGTREPSGTLRENAADLAAGVFPGYSVEELMKGLEAYQGMALSFGITTAHDAYLDVLPDKSSGEVEAYRNLEKQNRLRMRFRASLYVDPGKGLEQVGWLVRERRKNRKSLFQTHAAKMFMDGVVEGSTAYLKEPYKHRPRWQGEPLWNQDTFNAMCAELYRNGFQIHVHSIGDAATSAVLDGLEWAEKANGRRDSRHLVTHLQLVDPADIMRFKQLGVIAITQPFWFTKDDYYYNLQVPFLGQRRADEEYPMESFFRAGVVVTSSSDYPVTIPSNPLEAIQTGMTRSLPDQEDPKEILWPDQRTTLDRMIASFTINGAYAQFLEKATGSIETGKWADLIVLDRNVFEIPVTDIRKTKVLFTFFEGHDVFRTVNHE